MLGFSKEVRHYSNGTKSIWLEAPLLSWKQRRTRPWSFYELRLGHQWVVEFNFELSTKERLGLRLTWLKIFELEFNIWDPHA